MLTFLSRGQILSPWLEDIVDSGIGLTLSHQSGTKNLAAVYIFPPRFRQLLFTLFLLSHIHIHIHIQWLGWMLSSLPDISASRLLHCSDQGCGSGSTLPILRDPYLHYSESWIRTALNSRFRSFSASKLSHGYSLMQGRGSVDHCSQIRITLNLSRIRIISRRSGSAFKWCESGTLFPAESFSQETLIINEMRESYDVI